MHTLEQLRRGELDGAHVLRLRGGLQELPDDVLRLADTLEVLDLSDNRLATLPDWLPRLSRLRIVFCSNNPFTTLPAVLGQCESLTTIGFKSCRIAHVPAQALPPQLRWLILTDNRIAELPEALGDCRNLQKLALAGNQLATLPERMAGLNALELLRISANRLTALPDWIGQLPRLAWLAYAGNPFCAEQEQLVLQRQGLPAIEWSELELGTLLGHGASGMIHQAHWRAASGEGREVALKLFKGAVTSDGLPDSEMATWIQAGNHPQLISLLGRLDGHPQQAQGLVMPLIGPDFHALAGPPSLESCTRDVYPAGVQLPLSQVHRMALDLASVAAHLHENGVLHGDFYAHNTLHDGQGGVLVGDFGAASLLPDDAERSKGLQRVEVRAWGYLLEELLQHSLPPAAGEQALAEALNALLADCLQPDPGLRPLMGEVHARLCCIR